MRKPWLTSSLSSKRKLKSSSNLDTRSKKATTVTRKATLDLTPTPVKRSPRKKTKRTKSPRDLSAKSLLSLLEPLKPVRKTA